MPEPVSPPPSAAPDYTQTAAGQSKVTDTVTGSPSAAVPVGPAFGPPVAEGEVGTLGPYRVVKELGRGGMGAVYLATDTRLKRKIALKVMLPEFAANAAAKERFLREAQAAAQITHDNVVTVHEADERDGVPYIAMQFLTGLPLDQFLKQKPRLTAAQILRIAREAALGLSAAHKIGLVHRDIKPANLWLEAPGGRVKVLDFGLARPVHAEHELTQSGAVVGTPAYMSPEQARGVKVDSRTDLFSLGAMLYRLCTGELPFQGPTTMSVLMALGTEEPKPVRKVNPEVPESLAALVHQLLAKKPDDRPQTADDVVKRIRAIAEELTAPTRDSMPSTSLPQVVAAPVAAPPENSAFADLDATATESASAAVEKAPKPTRKKPGKGAWVAAGFVALVAAVAAGVIVIKIKNRDGTETEIKVPDGSTVTVEKDGKTLAQVPPAGKQPAATADPDRKAAEWALSIGGTVRVTGEDRDIKAAAELPKAPFTLAAAYFAGKAATDDGVAHLKGCKNLVALDMNGAKVTDAGLAHLKDCNNLKGLWLDNNQLTDAGLGHLKDCKNLKGLFLKATRVTAKGLAEFHAAVPGCTIEHDGGTIEPKAGDDRKAAEWVLFAGGTVRVNGGEGNVKAVAELPTGPFSLTMVSLAGNKAATDEGLAHLKNCRSLNELNLNDTGVADAGLANLKDCKSLTQLHLRNTGVTDTGLTPFKDCNNLTALQLQGTRVTDVGLAYFKDRTNLTFLQLHGTRVTDAGVANFKDCKDLTTLGLHGTQVTDAGLAYFKGCKKLTLLGLSATRVTDAGLANFEGCKDLTHLYLTGTRVGNAGLAHLKDCKSLTHLFLEGTGVTDTGLEQFKDCKNLTLIYLRVTQATDAGLAHLKYCKSLKELDVKDTKVTVKGLEAFHAALPGCKIEHAGGTIEPKK